MFNFSSELRSEGKTGFVSNRKCDHVNHKAPRMQSGLLFALGRRPSSENPVVSSLPTTPFTMDLLLR